MRFDIEMELSCLEERERERKVIKVEETTTTMCRGHRVIARVARIDDLISIQETMHERVRRVSLLQLKLERTTSCAQSSDVMCS